VQNDEQQIRDLVDTWMAATKTGDSQTVLGLMTDDVVFLVAGRAPFGKAEFAEAARAQADASLTFDGKSEILELNVLGNWAYMLTQLTVTSVQPGARTPAARSGHTLTILRKQDGQWRLARDANLLAPVA
jgi:uncharacterized protein (TIGR02246 family)